MTDSNDSNATANVDPALLTIRLITDMAAARISIKPSELKDLGCDATRVIPCVGHTGKDIAAAATEALETPEAASALPQTGAVAALITCDSKTSLSDVSNGIDVIREKLPKDATIIWGMDFQDNLESCRVSLLLFTK